MSLPSLRRWDLDANGQPYVVVDTEAELFRTADRLQRGDYHLWRHQDGREWVSTIFLWLDHAFLGGPPVLFETLGRNGPQRRTCTRAEAWAMHCAVCRQHGIVVVPKALTQD